MDWRTNVSEALCTKRLVFVVVAIYYPFWHLLSTLQLDSSGNDSPFWHKKKEPANMSMQLER